MLSTQFYIKIDRSRNDVWFNRFYYFNLYFIPNPNSTQARIIISGFRLKKFQFGSSLNIFRDLSYLKKVIRVGSGFENKLTSNPPARRDLNVGFMQFLLNTVRNCYWIIICEQYLHVSAISPIYVVELTMSQIEMKTMKTMELLFELRKIVRTARVFTWSEYKNNISIRKTIYVKWNRNLD